MTKNKRNIIVTIGLILLSILFTVLVKYVGVGVAGSSNTEVGFAKINGGFFNLVGVNSWAYTISTILGYIVIALIGVYLGIGLIQLIKRKSLFKVDIEILLLGLAYLITFVIYFAFEKVVINCRPIYLYNELEPSYPSTHTLLALTVSFCGIIANRSLFKDNKTVNVINLIIMILGIILVICRLLSGYHWLTDVVGGVIISFTIVACYNTAVGYAKSKKDE